MRVPPLLLLAGLAFFTELPASAQDKPTDTYSAHLSLVRYDMPVGFSSGYAPTRQLAVRKLDGGDAVDWVDISLSGKRLFQKGPEETLPVTIRRGSAASSPFQVATDDVIEPGNHWFRPIEWRPGRRHLYTADFSARSANSSDAATGRYELWTFPLKLSSEGAPAVKNVVVKYRGKRVYHRDGPWRSLTLLLPGNQPGHQYELSVDGRTVLRFDIGLMPVKLGSPVEQLYRVNATLPGDPPIKVWTVSRPERFPHAKEWAADVAALSGGLPRGPGPVQLTTPAQRLGTTVPRSPVTNYAMALPLGKSAGFLGQGARGFSGDTSQYAEYLEGLGYDAVFDPVGSIPDSTDPNSLERRLNVLGASGLQLGFQYDQNWSRPSLQHPNLAILAHSLPDWHRPLYRSASLAAQRFVAFPNFIGLAIGSETGGYGRHLQSAPPIPDRPWGEAMTAFMKDSTPRIPRSRSLGEREFDYEFSTATDEFNRYVARYESTFRQYGYFAEAVRNVSSRLVFTTGSFGGVPARGARGGWPWATVPGRVMFEGVAVQQAHDQNDGRAAKPMHLVSLIDRLRSYSPRKKTWALLDNFHGIYGREAFQRATAIVLTRGVQGVGTNFIPAQGGDQDREVPDYIREMNGWVRRYGGVIARTEPQAVIGVFYGHHQAVLRPVVTGDDPSPDNLMAGSHEGKVAEALFLCHAAGLPARVITYQELLREPLPSSMKAVFLVGLEKYDESWNWATGLEKPLGEFLQRGGRIIADETSFSPVECKRPGLALGAYVAQRDIDPTPQLFERNAKNIATLRAEFADATPLVASSGDPDVWVVPAMCGDVQYVTVLNQAFAGGPASTELLRAANPKATKPERWKTKANASLYVPPQTAEIEWRTDRPIYDVRSAQRLTNEQASKPDLTQQGFQWYALPPAEISGIELAVQMETAGGANPYYEAIVQTGGERNIRGIPVQITISSGKERLELFGATGWPIRLPLTMADLGVWQVFAIDLLAGTTSGVEIQPPGRINENPQNVSVRVLEPSALTRFALRKTVPLVVALTPEQVKQTRFMEQAKALEAYYRECGRTVSISRVEPGSVVESLQPLRSPHRYPRWKTVAADLVLIGTPDTNVLVRDQARGGLLPSAEGKQGEGRATVAFTRSAFVGEFDVLNVIASDEAGLTAAVKTIKGTASKD
jgi:hypothetical protein